MTIKPAGSERARSSSDESSDNDGSVSPPSRSPFHRAATSQETCSRSHETEKCPIRKRRVKNRPRRVSPSLSHATSPTKQKKTDTSGYNSSDEREPHARSFSKEKEDHFEQLLRKERGFYIAKMKEDGACLFRAVADQVYGDEEFHATVRASCMEYIVKNADFFAPYVAEDFQQYVRRKRAADCFGNNIEIQAMSELYNRSIEVYQYGTEPINIFQSVYHVQNAPIRISYHFNCHYNSITDPANPSVGVGLGLAGLEPGLADRNLLKGVCAESEQEAVEEAMLRNQMLASDWEATAQDLEQQVMQTSYLEYWKERAAQAEAARRKRRRPSPRTSPSAYGEDEYACQYSPCKRPSPPSSPSVQSLQSFQKHRMALQRMRKENMHLADLRLAAAAPPPASRGHRTASGGSTAVATTTASASPAARSAAAGGSRPSSASPSSASARQAAAATGSAASGQHAAALQQQQLWLAASSASGSRSSSVPSSGSAAAASATATAAAASASASVASSSSAAAPSSAAATTARRVQTDAMVAAELAAADLLDGDGGFASLDEANDIAAALAASKQQYYEDIRARQSGDR